MSNTCCRSVCLALVVWSVWFCSHAHALQVRDDRGVLLTLAHVPQRVVSLLPSLTETVCALGQCSRLVGVDDNSNYPEQVRKLPQLGSGLMPSLEAIIALRPDVVLMARSSTRSLERLQALGMHVLAFEPQTHAEVARMMTQLATLFAVSDAAQLWRSVDAGISAAAQALPAHARTARVYLEAAEGPYAATQASFIGETLHRLGAQNIVPHTFGPFPKINPEYVVRADPDILIVGQRAAKNLAQRPGWRALRALRARHVCVFSPAQADVLMRPGPRMADSAWWMAQCLSNPSQLPASFAQRPMPAHTWVVEDAR